jgi:di/tripeptidase
MKQGKITTSYFLRSNLIDGIEPMKSELVTALPETEWTMSQDTPVWLSDATSPFVVNIQEVFRDADDEPLPAVTTHAAVEVGMLAQKYPQTQWVSVGATVHNMHTTEEYIEIKDFEKFVERMETLIATLG